MHVSQWMIRDADGLGWTFACKQNENRSYSAKAIQPTNARKTLIAITRGQLVGGLPVVSQVEPLAPLDSLRSKIAD